MKWRSDAMRKKKKKCAMAKFGDVVVESAWTNSPGRWTLRRLERTAIGRRLIVYSSVLTAGQKGTRRHYPAHTKAQQSKPSEDSRQQ